MKGNPKETNSAVLPILDRAFMGLAAFDAKDPNSKFLPVRPLPPAGTGHLPKRV